MKKSLLLRLCCVASALFIAAACAGCGGGKKTSSGKKPAAQPDVEADEIVFPLEEPANFTVMIDSIQSTTFKSKLESNPIWQKWKEETNVGFDFMFMGNQAEATEQINLWLNAGTYGDALMGSPVLNSITASMYYESGMFIPLTPYVNEEYMPNLMKRVINDNPEVLKNVTAADGEVICIPQYDAGGTYLESPIWINRTWLNKVGEKVPQTTDDLKRVLTKFLKNDPNGNGKQDEIPLMVTQDVNYFTFEPWMSIWGIATKNGTNDAYVQLKNGRLEFVPTTAAYKDFLKYFHGLQQEELLYPEAMTASLSDVDSKLMSDVPMVGMYTYMSRYSATFRNDYVCMLPPKAPGYEPCWYVNPGVNGVKNICFVTDKCQNVGVLMKWLDRLYDFDTAMEFAYNRPGDGRMTKEGDKYNILDIDDKTFRALENDSPTVRGLTMWLVEGKTEDDYENRLNVTPSMQDNRDATALYGDILNKEIWPRPYLVAEDAYTISDISSDLFDEVREFMGNAIMGTVDIDSEWDAYVKRCESLGLDDFLAALERAYAVYTES